jgi:transposase
VGYFGRIEDKFKAQELRHQGLSYREILQTIFVSKDTISKWCRDIKLTEKQKLRLLENKKFGQRKGSLVAAENKRKARIERTAKIREEARKTVGRLNAREMFVAGIALYAAEGNKSDGKAGFSNADPKLIKFMMDWFLTFAKVPMDKMRGAIWLHEGLSEKNAKKFWSDLVSLPSNQFHKTYIAKVKNNSKKVRKNIHQYGVIQIRFSDSAIHRKIMGWIYTVFHDRIKLV